MGLIIGTSIVISVIILLILIASRGRRNRRYSSQDGSWLSDLFDGFGDFFDGGGHSGGGDCGGGCDGAGD